jgi:dATP/dGTP diphosphohydrolase, N-terminal
MGDNTAVVGDINSAAKGSGARANKGKVALSLVPLHLLAGAARVFMAGKYKYAPYNWAKGMAWSICVDCLLRHLFKWWYLGEDIDEETGEHHLDHMICNLLMLRHYELAFKEGDDRPDIKLTHFHGAWINFTKLFDEEDFLNRNPTIREKLNAG